MRNLQAPSVTETPGCAARRTLWRVRRSLLAGALAVAVAGCGDEADTIFVPVTYVVAGRVADPTQSPIAGIEGAHVEVETASQVVAVTSDANGDFILQGVPAGVHRLRVDQAGKVSTVTYDFMVGANVANAFVPLFTAAQIDSILDARGAPAWNRSSGLFGLFALKSTGVPLGDAVATFAPSTGGTLVQTGEGADPIVVVNGQPGTFQLTVTRGGYVWDGPYAVSLRPNLLTFAAPRARPNFNGFVFADGPGGPPVPGTTVTALRGPSAGATATTNFLGQFSIVGLMKGTYLVRALAPGGYLPTLSLPQPMDQDTTLATIVYTPDSLAAWAAAGGQAPPDLARGVIALTVHDEKSGVLLGGATVAVEGVTTRSTMLSERAPALALDVPPGMYRLVIRPFGTNTPVITVDSVDVAAGEVTSGRVEWRDVAVPAARTSLRQRR